VWLLFAGVVAFVILGAVGVLVLGDRVARRDRRRRRAKESEREDAW
jgi:hypothetical protein